MKIGVYFSLIQEAMGKSSLHLGPSVFPSVQTWGTWGWVEIPDTTSKSSVF